MAGGQCKSVPLLSPEELRQEQPASAQVLAGVAAARAAVTAVLDGTDDRLLVVLGPCSVHDLDATLMYARRLRELGRELAEDVVLVLRTYFEKPRTRVGWPGLLSDPWLDGGYALEDGLRMARALLLEVSEMDVAAACEWLSPAVPDYLGDLVSWGAIGARTVTSPVHRQLASGLPMPVGLKNAVDGDVRHAVDAIVAASRPQVYPGVGARGRPVVVHTSGNADCHLVLRGGERPNYGPAEVAEAMALLAEAGLPRRVVIDASHGNSGKDHLRQHEVALELAGSIAAGQEQIRGLLLESFLEPGRQDWAAGRPLVFGRSITDACMGWRVTEELVRTLAGASRTRRALLAERTG
ncbi:3-deoxy-7-phosphoheptulonate synthase [Kutzneria albida]|uniref:Phospho-2-dehydro-3-deoxyheptonate aldolase n=1 Tax=Kutzneria albida DSM 43870 TaxID=1449976 RepID=W5WBP7_9PSEU|nr:3-deoxy-7-phosphoheptulonate synthase [Kutzneria albida]AHH98170.1 hypothetical protein KALB_4808 [Kutzneria albida DSM 43870]